MAGGPPQEPVWAAGSTAAFPALANLLATIARLPAGLVVLPGLDRELPERVWQALGETHPQAGLRRLLLGMNADRGDVAEWPVRRDGDAAAAARSAVLSRALLPAAALELWREDTVSSAPGLLRLPAADEQEEAVAIALALREALEQPGSRAALVTPDRTLARRVAAELSRFGVIADDSAGEELAATPPGVFLRLLAGAAASGFAPVDVLALLKHPLAAAGLSPASCREAARLLERAVLRGQRPGHGLAGLRRRFDRTPEAAGHAAVADLLARMERGLAPLLREIAAVGAQPAELLKALIQAAEALAATDDEPGDARLWAGEDGAALADVLAPALDSLAMLPDQPPRILAGLLDALMEGAVVRTRRALRGRAGIEHPRIFIWGLIEARLQNVDTIVLGGLVEGVWPPATDPGPWLSRPMRAAIGLPSPEQAIGQAAHDFAAAACAAPLAVLSGPRRRDGAPAVPARWLTRLEAYLGPTALTQHPAVGWARALDQPAGDAQPVAPPEPRPPVAARPRRLTVSDVEIWLKDPYAIHAKYILGLRPLEPLDQATEHADFGTIVHAALRRFVDVHGALLPDDTAAELRRLLHKELAGAELRKALIAWWQPRLDRIADWLASQERERRNATELSAIAAECAGTWTLRAAGGPFVIAGRADRIERRADGRIALLDYKTGSVPTKASVHDGRAPQLPLEAAMAAAGAFGPAFTAEAAELTYLQLTGDRERGKIIAMEGDLGTVVARTEAGLRRLIDAYDDPDRPYLARPVPRAAPRFGAYGQLARVSEWIIQDEADG